MKIIQIATTIICLGGAILSCPAFSTLNNVASNASVVYLRTSCIEGASPQVIRNNCFDGSNAVNELTTWIAGTRRPSASSPLSVEVGPGTYPTLTCTDWGYTTFRGAGQSQTTFTGTNQGLKATRCTELEFRHLTISSSSGVLPKGVLWVGPGNSHWVDVSVIGGAYGWYEATGSTACTDNVKGNAGKHYWFSSRIKATSNSAPLIRAYFDACGSENWFFGSELFADAPNPTALVAAHHQQGNADSHFYGSVIRVNTNLVSGGDFPPAAILAAAGSVHIHGTGIDVISTVPNNNIAALVTTSDGAEIHANGAAYNLDAGQGGTIARIVKNGGHVHAPYLWEQHSTPPNITSVDGADVAVVTTAGGAPRFLIYSDACATSKWFDVGANACRP